MSNDLDLHGWTAVPRSFSTLLEGKPHLHPPRPDTVPSLGFPTTDPLVVRIHDHAKAQLRKETYNHSMRVYYFALSILRTQFPHLKLSASTLALACLLHDIGTTAANLRATRLSFEFYGGLRSLALLEGERAAEAVAEAVMRHQDLGETGKITALGAILQLATVYDNMGQNPGLIHETTLEDVVAHFPRKGWSGCFAATIREENELKPWAHTTALGEEDFPNGVLGNKLMARFE